MRRGASTVWLAVSFVVTRSCDLEFTQLVDDLRADPFQPHLRLHPLAGAMAGQHAVSLTYDYRVVLILRVTERHITLIAIGDHDLVYGQHD